MKKPIKTLGISLILMTVSASANTVFADVNDDLSLSCNIPENGSVSIRWKAQNNDKVSSYKIYVSDPLSQADCYSPDLTYKYQEDSSKLYAANTEYVLKDLVKGRFYSFKLEAYKDDKLVKSDSVISLIPDKDYGSKFEEVQLFDTVCLIDQHTAKIEWTDIIADKTKRTMKFYNIEDNGLKEIGSADFAAGSCVFEKLETNKKYYIAAEVLSGDKTEYTYQFGFTTDYSAPQKISKNEKLKNYSVGLDGTNLDVTKEINISTDKKTGIRTSEIVSVDPGSENCKIYVSDPMSSKDFYARKDFTNYKQYVFLDHYVSCDKETGFDPVKLCKNIKSGRTYESDTDDITSDGYRIDGLKPEMYYSIRVDGFSNGKLTASGSAVETVTSLVNRENLFWDSDFEYSNERIDAKSKDGKTVVLTWEDLAEKYDYPEGKRTIYLYLSDAYKDKKKIYNPDYPAEDPKVSAKYIGKTDYGKLKYKLKGLTPGRHYVLYLEEHFNGKIESIYDFHFSTTVNVPDLELRQVNTNAVKISSDVSVTLNNNDSGKKFLNTCIRPEVVEYYKKDKNGKFKKIATVAVGKTVTDKGVSLGKTYSYKARAYATINGKKVYSEFSYFGSSQDKIKIVNPKPTLKVSLVNKKQNIVKLTSNGSNDDITIYEDDNLLFSTDGKKFSESAPDLKSGKTVYIKVLNKKKKDVRVYYCYDSNYYTLSLDLNRSSFKLAKEK